MDSKIEKQVVLRAPLERVWRAISDSQEFGRWFGVSIDGPFVAGRSVMRFCIYAMSFAVLALNLVSGVNPSSCMNSLIRAITWGT